MDRTTFVAQYRVPDGIRKTMVPSDGRAQFFLHHERLGLELLWVARQVREEERKLNEIIEAEKASYMNAQAPRRVSARDTVNPYQDEQEMMGIISRRPVVVDQIDRIEDLKAENELLRVQLRILEELRLVSAIPMEP